MSLSIQNIRSGGGFLYPEFLFVCFVCTELYSILRKMQQSSASFTEVLADRRTVPLSKCQMCLFGFVFLVNNYREEATYFLLFASPPHGSVWKPDVLPRTEDNAGLELPT